MKRRWFDRSPSICENVRTQSAPASVTLFARKVDAGITYKHCHKDGEKYRQVGGKRRYNEQKKGGHTKCTRMFEHWPRVKFAQSSSINTAAKDSDMRIRGGKTPIQRADKRCPHKAHPHRSIALTLTSSVRRSRLQTPPQTPRDMSMYGDKTSIQRAEKGQAPRTAPMCTYVRRLTLIDLKWGDRLNQGLTKA